jgi:two-component system LytT family response regulator
MPEKITAIIVEDEEPAKVVLREYLKDFPEIEVVAEVTDGFTAVKRINEQKPHLIFLDIQLPKLTGFEIIELLDSLPLIIFTTAYDQFAIQAFEKNAIDYLLKPFSYDRFSMAVYKAIEKINTQQNDDVAVKNVMEHLSGGESALDRIVVKTNSAIKVISIEQILYIEAQDDYVMLYTTIGKFLKEKTMKFFEKSLPQQQFIRIHRSYIVNVDYIVQIEHYTKDNYIAILQNGTKLRISDSGYKLLRSQLNF